jgi:hypothetical protein
MRPSKRRALSNAGWALGVASDNQPIQMNPGITAMTQSQRLKYSVLIALVVLAIMLGLSWMQNAGMITEKVFQYIAIGVAVVVVVINGIMRRKVKP